MTNKQDLIQYANNLISKSLDIMKSSNISSDEELFRNARHGGNSAEITLMLNHPKVDKMYDSRGWTPLHYLGYSTNPAVLKHSSIDKVPTNDHYNKETPLHLYAKNERNNFINHPSMTKVKSQQGNTPLHYMASNGNMNVLKYKQMDKIKNNKGETPLHILAGSKNVKQIDHPSMTKVKNDNGQTPQNVYDNNKYGI